MNMGKTAIRLAQPDRAAPAAIAGIISLAKDFKSRDPITCYLGWRNNSINTGTDPQVLAGYVMGLYEASTKLFYPAYFTAGGKDYVCGAYRLRTTPAQGATEAVELNSYIVNVATVMTLDILAFIYKKGPLASYSVNWGWGSRMIGMSLIDFQRLSPYGLQVYTGAITISP